MPRIALAQINPTVGDLEGNYRKIIAFIRQAQDVQADIVVFPELAITGYPPEDLLYKDHFVRDNIRTLQRLAKGVNNVVVVVGFVDYDRTTGNLYNAAAVIFQRRIKGIYHKHDLPNYGVFDEKRYFTKGETSPLFVLDRTGIGINICEDIWVEDGVYARQVKAGAKILINISASPYDFGKLERREKLLMHRAKVHHAFICYVNLVGGQDELVFDGDSLIVAPNGKIIAAGKQFEEDLIVADFAANHRAPSGEKCITLKKSRETLKQPLPRSTIEKISPVERIYKALILGTRDYVRKNGFKKVVIGLSGGIDSSLVAAIAVQAIGRENVVGISMPSQFNSIETRADAKQLAQNLGIRYIEIPIDGIFAAYLFVLREEFGDHPLNVAEENLQARIRGNLLMAFSNKFGWLVLTTGNKSEVAVGYCTLYGDMAGGFAVIKDLPKIKVYEVAELINRNVGNWIPQSVFNRAPTAELRKNQKDEDALPPYPVLDNILREYIEEHKSLTEMVKKYHNTQLVKDVISMVDRSEYKRRQAPPGIKITTRAFGKDWRLPITNKYKEF